MNREVVQYLLRGLLDRASKGNVGVVSDVEKEAIATALSLLDGKVGTSTTLDSALPVVHVGTSSVGGADLSSLLQPAEVLQPAPEAVVTASPVLVAEPAVVPRPPVKLDTSALNAERVKNDDLCLCLDFGTAMSKAFALNSDGSPYEILLGQRAGASGYTVPSTLFIRDDGIVLFGQSAIEESLELLESGRERLDSIKNFLSLRMMGNLDSEACMVRPSINPVSTVRLTEGDLIRAYLAYLTDLAVSEMVDAADCSRYVSRRFAHPCWNAQQKAWAEPLMRQYLAQAQILADTFHDKWAEGVHVEDLKQAIDLAKRLPQLPDWLIREGVPEPVAAASGVMADGTEKREPFMVIDVGAGTTDFGVFVIRESEELDLSKVFQIPETSCGLKQAGDKVDALLLKHILDDAQIDVSDSSGRLIHADLKRRIRYFKERLFSDGVLSYVLADSTTGQIKLEDFLQREPVQKFQLQLEEEFLRCLEAADDSWLSWISKTDLKVVLTGGGAALPMVQRLASGPIRVKNYNIMRRQADSVPRWIQEEADYLEPVFDQLAVAIGGAAPELPETLDGPNRFGGGGGLHSYVAGTPANT